MKKLVLTIAILGLCGFCWAEQNQEDLKERLQTATDVVQKVVNAPDKGVPDEVLKGAKCVAVVPHLIKGAFIFGAEHGRGIATCRTTNGWSAPAFFTITGGSWGAQIGAQSTDLVMLFMSDQGARHLMDAKFRVGADASAAAGPVGRTAAAGTDWKANTEILTYSHSHGAFVGVSLNGAYIEKDGDSTKLAYGKDLDFRPVLSGEVPVPSVAEAFVREIRRAKVEAAEK